MSEKLLISEQEAVGDASLLMNPELGMLPIPESPQERARRGWLLLGGLSVASAALGAATKFYRLKHA